MRVIALIDGEHHPPVVRDALGRLASRDDVRGVLFLGGGEKVAGGVLDDAPSHYGFELVEAGADAGEALRGLAAATGAEAVVDLSGDPVLDGAKRLELAATALDVGIEYVAPGFRVGPPPIEDLEAEVPVLSVIGTGKRCGKTAVAGHLARLLGDRGLDPVIVSMGRGGPAEPTLVRADDRPDRAGLLEISRAGGHAASDYLEDAVLAGVTTIGCRRCGEGPAGEVFDSNFVAGARLALALEPVAVVLEGSGAALPPVSADRTICVVGARRARTDALSYLGPYRLLQADLVLLVGADELSAEERQDVEAGIARWCRESPVIACMLEPEPVEEIPPGARVAVFTTAPEGAETHMRARLAERGVEVEFFSANLARREALERDTELAARQGCNLFLTELKAAAVEVVAEQAERRGARVVFLRNRPQALTVGQDLDAALLGIYEGAADEHAGQARPAASRS